MTNLHIPSQPISHIILEDCTNIEFDNHYKLLIIGDSSNYIFNSKILTIFFVKCAC